MKGSGAKALCPQEHRRRLFLHLPRRGRNQSVAIEGRTCKHLRKQLRGDTAEGGAPSAGRCRQKAG